MNEFQLRMLSDYDFGRLAYAVSKEKKSRNLLKEKARKMRAIAKRANRTILRFSSLDDLNQSVTEKNSSNFYSVPNHGRVGKYSSTAVYLPALIGQDWSSIYNGGDQDKKYYVYIHLDPRHGQFVAPKSAGGSYHGQPFYVGKGCDNRAYDLKRNQGHGKLIKDILNEGFDSSSIVKIIYSNLTEADAFAIEAKLIYFFGVIYTKKSKGCLLNLDIPATPIFIGEMCQMKTQGQWDQERKENARYQIIDEEVVA